ncbi:MAG TPA: hypothetical protein DEA40_02180, partial [Parvularcula sp.]|nr:hypothetical protein [Parvularcula sp.]
MDAAARPDIYISQGPLNEALSAGSRARREARTRMPHRRLKVGVTRKLPDAVEARLSDLFDTTLNP